MIGLRQILIPLLIVISGFVSLEFAIPIAFGEFIAGIVGGHLFDLSDIPWVKFFSHLGLLGVMFLAGFEIDTRILKLNLKRNLAIGSVSFFTPYTIVIIISLSLEIPIRQALVLATALSTTSLAMVFTVLRQSRQTANKQGQILLGSAMIVDLLSMISLVLIVLEFSLYNLVFLIALVLILIFIKKTVIIIFKRYSGNVFEFELKFFLLILLALGFLAEGAGLHAALIAFLTGIIFSDIEPEHEKIIEKLNTVVFSLLAPIFFFHAGSLLKFHNVSSPVVFYMFIILLVGAVGGKFIGTYLGLYYFHNKKFLFAKYGGIIFNYRLSFGIVTGIYAFEKKIIDISLLSIILLIVSISSILSVIMSRKRR